MLTSSINYRREHLHNEISILYDRPLKDACIPEIETKVKLYADELGPNDSVLREFIIEACVLFINYRIEIRKSFDPENESRTFEWFEKIGPEEVVEIFRKTSTSYEFKAYMARLVAYQREKAVGDDIILARLIKAIDQPEWPFVIEAASSLGGIFNKQVQNPDLWDMLGDVDVDAIFSPAKSEKKSDEISRGVKSPDNRTPATAEREPSYQKVSFTVISDGIPIPPRKNTAEHIPYTYYGPISRDPQPVQRVTRSLNFF